MQLTAHTDLALRLIIYLIVRPGQKVSTKEVAEAYGISLNHLTKVAKSLTRAGWLVSARGGGGGLMLAQHTLDATVGEIVRHTEANWEIAECFKPKGNGCVIAPICQLKPVLYQARRAFFDVLDSVKIRQIATNPRELGMVFAQASASPRGLALDADRESPQIHGS